MDKNLYYTEYKRKRGNNMVDLTKISFEELNNNAKDFSGNFEMIVKSGEDWQIVRDKGTGKFFVYECGYMSFYEVRRIAKLEYDVLNDIQCT